MKRFVLSPRLVARLIVRPVHSVLHSALSFGALLMALPAMALDSVADTAAGAPAAVVKAVSPIHTIASVPPPSTSSSSMSMLFGLSLVLGVIVCVAWLLKRTGLAPAMQASAAAKVVGGVSVGSRERVVVVEVGDQWIVVGVAPGRVNALTTMPKRESVPDASAPAAKNFASWMKQTIEKRNGPR
jgi:flagellar protein FliO/FliZ